MILNKSVLTTLFNTVRAEWDRLMTVIKPTYNEWAMTLPSTTNSETHNWADLIVQIRKWVGERIFGNIKAQTWTVVSDDYEGSFDLSLNDIADDKIGLLLPKTQNLYSAAVYHPEHLLEQVALDGFDHVCFDGQFFFDTDHPSLTGDGTTVSNVGTEALTYENVRMILNTKGLTISGSTGDPLDIEPYAIMVGPSQLGIAEALYNDEKKPDSLTESNQLRSRLKPVLNRKFVGAYANYFVIMYRFRGSNLTPFIYQERKVPIVATTMFDVASPMGMDAQDYLQFMHNAVAFGTHHRGNATFTLWCLAYGSTGGGTE